MPFPLRLLPLIVMAACTPVLHNTVLHGEDPVQGSTPIRWQEREPGCLQHAPYEGAPTREQLWSRSCQGAGTHDFIGLALSGGGTKAAVFSAETMFYLQALGVLPHVAALSSVSGGSFAGAYYAASCDRGDDPCWARLQATQPGLAPPLWDYGTAMPILGSGYGPLIPEQIARAFVPFVPATISAPRFADFIDTRYFGNADPHRQRLRFSDLNPRRPSLFLNATIISNNRGGLGDGTANGCRALRNRGYLRRRTPDEWFHFAFTDFYFGLLRSSVADYPLAAAVAASAAFVALIDPAELDDGCNPGSVIKLVDGGANDNQALIELYIILAELGFGQRRSDLEQTAPGKTPLGPRELQTMGPLDRAWILLVNSSVTGTTGPAGTKSGPQPHGLLELLFSVAGKAFEVIDVFTAEGFALRSQLYLDERDRLSERDRLAKVKTHPLLVPIEISLTELDQYDRGGTEAALREKAGYQPTPTDVGDQRSAGRARRQQAAYEALVYDPRARHALQLSDWHPQCYFNMRDKLDASLISIGDDDQACLRDAARWATALRMQELCNLAAGRAPIPAPEGLTCRNGHAVLDHPDVLAHRLPGTCKLARDDDAFAKAAARHEGTAGLCQPLPPMDAAN